MNRSWRGEIAVIAGGAAIAVTLFASHPAGGAWSLGWWRIAVIVIGLVVVAAGLVAVLRPSVERTTTNKAIVVAVTVIAVGAFAFALDSVPVPNCSSVGQTPENRGVVYCDRDGRLMRMSIRRGEECPDGSFGYTGTVRERSYGSLGFHWLGYGWIEYGSGGNGCPL